MTTNPPLSERIDTALTGLPEDIRLRASQQLADLLSDRELTIDTFRRALSNVENQPNLASAAAWLVGLVGIKELTPNLIELVHETTPIRILWEVVKALDALEAGHAALRHLLDSATNAEARKAAAYGLGFLHDKEAVGTLVAIVQSAEEPADLRGQAVEALGYIGGYGGFEALVQAARDPAPEVRFWAAFALGESGDLRARPVLEELTADHTAVEGWWEISKEALDSLERLARPEQDSGTT